VPAAARQRFFQRKANAVLDLARATPNRWSKNAILSSGPAAHVGYGSSSLIEGLLLIKSSRASCR
jgi:hypothetical protein